MKQVMSAGVVVYRRHKGDIEYLLLHYPAGHWDFAKGHVEKNETLQQAALRELEEEAGITAQVCDRFKESFSYIFTHDTQKIRKTVTFFVGRAITDHVRLSHEHIDFTWLPYEKALNKLTYDNAKNLLNKIHTHIKIHAACAA